MLFWKKNIGMWFRFAFYFYSAIYCLCELGQVSLTSFYSVYLYLMKKLNHFSNTLVYHKQHYHFSRIILKDFRVTYWLLCGKSRRCFILTKAWFKVSAGVILKSASISNIFFNRLTNSLLSAFSAKRSLPSKSITVFTCKIKISSHRIKISHTR